MLKVVEWRKHLVGSTIAMTGISAFDADIEGVCRACPAYIRPSGLSRLASAIHLDSGTLSGADSWDRLRGDDLVHVLAAAWRRHMIF